MGERGWGGARVGQAMQNKKQQCVHIQHRHVVRVTPSLSSRFYALSVRCAYVAINVLPYFLSVVHIGVVGGPFLHVGAPMYTHWLTFYI